MSDFITVWGTEVTKDLDLLCVPIRELSINKRNILYLWDAGSISFLPSPTDSFYGPGTYAKLANNSELLLNGARWELLARSR